MADARSEEMQVEPEVRADEEAQETAVVEGGDAEVQDPVSTEAGEATEEKTEDAPEGEMQVEVQTEGEVKNQIAAKSVAAAQETVAGMKVVAIPAAALEKAQKPKKPMSSYFVYTTAMREVVAKEIEQQTGSRPKFGDLNRTVSARWVSLPPAEKKVWEDKAAADKQRYELEMQTYMESSDISGAMRAKFQHLIPKRPVGPIALFSADAGWREKATEALKAEGKEVTAKNLCTKLHDMWKTVGAADRAPFQEFHLRQQSEYIEKQKVWEARPEYEELKKAEQAQADLKKAVEAAKAAEEAARLEREAQEKRLARKRAKEAKDVTPASKKAKGESLAVTPDAKGAKAKAPETKSAKAPAKGKAHTTAAPEPHLDEKVVAEAAKLGMEASLRNLASRPEIMASGKTARAILNALQASGGLVNPAKRALVGA